MNAAKKKLADQEQVKKDATSGLQGAMDEANRINEEKDSLVEAKRSIERKIKAAQVLWILTHPCHLINGPCTCTYVYMYSMHMYVQLIPLNLPSVNLPTRL